MRHFVLPDSFDGQEEFDLPPEDAHYLKNVLRLRKGDSLPGRDKTGGTYHLTLVDVGSELVRLRVQPKGGGTRDASTSLVLYQCLPKGSKFDEIVRRATEIGVKSIVPVLSDYSVPKFRDPRHLEGKMERWRRIVRDAVQQSGSAIVPEIVSPLELSEMERLPAEGDDGVMGLFFHQAPLSTKSLHHYLATPLRETRIVIGPEGGFSDGEVSYLVESGYNPVYLGPQVLRTETAAIFAMAAVATVVLEQEAWQLRNLTS
jgi:16S rRNA (uracil1498-N3)-methyltransferase